MQEMFAALGALFTNPLALALMLLGTVVGIVFGALPGMSATLAVAVFLPLTYSLDVFTSVPLLMALYIGGISGGLISAILINIPGTPSSIATTFDGAPMALRGEGGKAIGTGVVFSFLGTIISIIVLVILAPALAKVAINFGPYEYFAVTACSFLLVAGLCGKDMLKGIISALLGILVACIGLAPLDSAARYVFGATQLKAGFSTVPVLVGLFAFPELLRLVEKWALKRWMCPRSRASASPGQSSRVRSETSSVPPLSVLASASFLASAPVCPTWWPTALPRRRPSTRRSSAPASWTVWWLPRPPITPPLAAP